MQTLQRFAMAAVFTLTCFTVPVTSVAATEEGYGEATVRREPPPARDSSSQNAEGAESRLSGLPGSTAHLPKVVEPPVGGPGTPVQGPGKTLQELKTRLEESFRKERHELQLTIEAARKSKLADRKRQERERNRDRRTSLNSTVLNRMLELQRSLLELSFEDLKSRRSDHRELIDAAKDAIKERAREASRERRGHGD
jgi:hypothetical protein